MTENLPTSLTGPDLTALMRFRKERKIKKPLLQEILFLPEELSLIAGFEANYSEILREELKSLDNKFSQYRDKVCEEVKAYYLTLIQSKKRFATAKESHDTKLSRLAHIIFLHKHFVREEIIEDSAIDRDWIERYSKQLYEEFNIPNVNSRKEELLSPFPKLREFEKSLGVTVEKAKSAIMQYFPVLQSTNTGEITWQIIREIISLGGHTTVSEHGKMQHHYEAQEPYPMGTLVLPKHAELLGDIFFGFVAESKNALNNANDVMKGQVKSGQLPIDLETRLHLYNAQARHFHNYGDDSHVGFFFAYAAATLNELQRFTKGVIEKTEKYGYKEKYEICKISSLLPPHIFNGFGVYYTPDLIYRRIVNFDSKLKKEYLFPIE